MKALATGITLSSVWNGRHWQGNVGQAAASWSVVQRVGERGGRGAGVAAVMATFLRRTSDSVV